MAGLCVDPYYVLLHSVKLNSSVETEGNSPPPPSLMVLDEENLDAKVGHCMAMAISPQPSTLSVLVVGEGAGSWDFSPLWKSSFFFLLVALSSSVLSSLHGHSLQRWYRPNQKHPNIIMAATALTDCLSRDEQASEGWGARGRGTCNSRT